MYFFICLAGLLVASCNAVGQDPASIAAISSSNVCKHPNGYIPVEGSCDSYISCRQYVPSNEVCPDGLNFNPSTEFPEYPCSYPTDAPCKGKRVQLPNPTADCPHQYGYFPSPSAPKNDCGGYRMCVEGRAIDMNCPAGLAFDPVYARCDWVERVPSCLADNFLGFKCPPGTVDISGNPIVSNHKYEYDCYSFFSCMNGNARLLSCDSGLAFDDKSGSCISEERVPCAIPMEVAAQ